MNFNIPHFRALVRESYYTKNPADSDNWYEVICFGIQSLEGCMLSFHTMTSTGMMRSRVPLSEVYIKEPVNDIPYHYKQLWDAFSTINTHVVVYDFLAGKRAQCVLKDRSLIWCSYLMTVDWFDNPYSDTPEDYKCAHILVADDGYLLAMPNNRLRFYDSNWITKPFPTDLQRYKVDTELLSVESVSQRWVSDDSDCYFYDLHADIDKTIEKR